MAILVPKVLHRDDNSVVYRCGRVLDAEERREIERTIRSELSNQRNVVVVFHDVGRRATIVVGYTRDSR